MTLTPYPPRTLDELALRLLDIAANVRIMANKARDNAVDGFQLNGQKAQEWLDRLEQWSHEAQARLEAQIHRERGARRALEKLPPAPRTRATAPKKTRKK